MDNLKDTFKKMDIKKVEKDKEFKKLYDSVKELLENNIYEDCYIFEYIEQYNKTDFYDVDNRYSVNGDKTWVNDLKYKKRKEIVKIKEHPLNKDYEEFCNSVVEWANEGHDDVQFAFNTYDNRKNPNKHLYKILSICIVDEYEISYFHNPDGEQETSVKLRCIIPISLKPFKM